MSLITPKNHPFPDTLEGWLAYLESLHPKGEAGIELGLGQVRQVSKALGQRPFCPVITVTGTNGKGSTAAFLESVLCRAGYRVGCYASPHLLNYNERVRLNGQPIDDMALCRAFAQVEKARQEAGNTALTYFEFGTLAAWQVFSEACCEALILEVGLGGRLDAVNLYDADVAIITTIDLDHQNWLGRDKESIGFEKAGIFRANMPALCGDSHPPESVLSHAQKLGAPLYVMERDFGFSHERENRQQWHFWSNIHKTVRRTLAYPGMRGEAQIKNATLCLSALEILRQTLPCPMQAIREGLIHASLPGRFQVLPGQPTVILDVAHNPQAVRLLAKNLSHLGFAPKTLAVLGMFSDKDVAGCVAALKGKIDHWFLASLSGLRGLSAQSLEKTVSQIDAGVPTTCLPNPQKAFLAAQKQAHESDRIVVFGSFHTVAGVLRTLHKDQTPT